jgi:heme-degrading monooxygenase HmoA
MKAVGDGGRLTVDPALEPRPRNAPEGHWPDFTTYFLRYPAGMREVVRVTIGAFGQGAGAFVDGVIASMRGADEPVTIERGREIVSAGRSTQIVFAYWDDVAAYRRWQHSPAVERLFDGGGSPSRWCETAILPLTHTEAHFGKKSRETGLGRLAGTHHAFCPMVGYWGAARDRIPVSADDPLQPGAEVPPAVPGEEGERSIVAPANLCTIRTSQDWQVASAEHLKWYQEEVEPVLCAGVEYLDANPRESGCLSVRYIRETDLEGADLDRTCVLAHFRSLEHLERWARDHPTHHSIFEALMKMVRQFGEDLGVSLFHEVSVLPQGHFHARYIGVDRDAGILRDVDPDEPIPPGCPAHKA